MWRSTKYQPATDGRWEPRFSVEFYFTRRGPTLVLAGHITAAAESVLDGILLRVHRVDAPMHLQADSVNEISDRALELLVRWAHRRPGRTRLLLDSPSTPIGDALQRLSLIAGVEPMDPTAATISGADPSRLNDASPQSWPDNERRGYRRVAEHRRRGVQLPSVQRAELRRRA